MKKKNNNDIVIIVEKVKEGDTSAFRVLIDEYKDVSFSLACSILKDHHEAEDAVQESFLKAFKNIRKFNQKSSFATWFYRIVVNTCLTIVRKQDKIQLHEDIGISNMDSPGPITGHEEFVALERKEIINTALQMMKPEESLLLRLYYLSELDISEIQAITGYKESKIKVTLFRGRKNLHTNLSKMLGNELTLLL